MEWCIGGWAGVEGKKEEGRKHDGGKGIEI